MSNPYSEILKHIRMVSGNNLIAVSVKFFLDENDMTSGAIFEITKQLQDQIRDNPQMMRKVLNTNCYEFFSNYDLMPLINKVA